MLHPVRLLPEDTALLRFLWDNLDIKKPPNVYKWQVLPFGTTCSPCCATFALQKHVFDHSQPGEDVWITFYVDNCRQSLPTVTEAQHLVDKLTALLANGGFELWQWATNVPETIRHLPREARSESSELWLGSQVPKNLPWVYAGFVILTLPDAGLAYPTMRNIYRALAHLYDPLGFIVTFTMQAKLIVQRLWD